MSILFPIEPQEQLLSRLRRLNDDLARIAAGTAPAADELGDAPILDHWAYASRFAVCLAGATVGHPKLGNRPLVATSELFVIDPLHGWARTFSRFYRLGRPADPDADGGNA